MDRKVLLVSNYNAVRRPFNGVAYEFFAVIAGIESATIVAPGAAQLGPTPSVKALLDAAGRELGGHLRRAAGRSFGPQMRPATAAGEYDLCLFMCQFSKNLADIESVRNWRRQSRVAVAFVLETWSSQFEERKADLKILDQFDLVFVLNASSIPALGRYTRTPIAFLPTAADALLACPGPEGPERVVDVFSMGRRLPPVHDALRGLARERGLFYVHDVWFDAVARDWAEARAWNADMVKRSRYYVAWDPVAFASKRDEELIGADRAISTRYFEGAAGGAILIGSRPDCAEFEALFDWPDAVVEVAPDGSDLETVLDGLDADAGRVRAARARNVIESLRRHDWAYRWERILAAAGLAPSPAHRRRVAELARRAEQMEAVAMATGRPGAYKTAAG